MKGNNLELTQDHLPKPWSAAAAVIGPKLPKDPQLVDQSSPGGGLRKL
jgi:hypothetical protein